jgi:hypothetical protein
LVFETKDLLHKGLRKRVGSGLLVSVFKDPWLLDPHNAYVETTAPTDIVDITVDAFRNEYSKLWDISLLEGVFSSRDVQEILQIPLSLRQVEDDWYWFFDSKGVYTVKLAYRQLLLCDNPPSNNSGTDWKKIWQLYTPPKTKNLLWRALSSCLPTRMNLRKRQVDVIEACPICNQLHEDELHIFVKCPFAKAVWTSSIIGDRSGTANSFEYWWNDLALNQSKDTL